MTKTELEAFLAVLQYGSISAAAERLFITQPAMSRRMKSMEEELGYSLFERGRGQRSVELTENGKEFVPVAERLLALYREAEEIPRRKKSPLLRIRWRLNLVRQLVLHVGGCCCHILCHNRSEEHTSELQSH